MLLVMRAVSRSILSCVIKVCVTAWFLPMIWSAARRKSKFLRLSSLVSGDWHPSINTPVAMYRLNDTHGFNWGSFQRDYDGQWLFLTSDTLKWLISRMMLTISCAAILQRARHCLIILWSRPCFSAFDMAAWWRQIVEAWIFMFRYTTLGSHRPAGSLSRSGRNIKVFESTFSILRCRFQNSPFMKSSGWSFGPGRCRWSQLWPKRHAISTTPA